MAARQIIEVTDSPPRNSSPQQNKTLPMKRTTPDDNQGRKNGVGPSASKVMKLNTNPTPSASQMNVGTLQPAIGESQTQQPENVGAVQLHGLKHPAQKSGVALRISATSPAGICSAQPLRPVARRTGGRPSNIVSSLSSSDSSTDEEDVVSNPNDADDEGSESDNNSEDDGEESCEDSNSDEEEDVDIDINIDMNEPVDEGGATNPPTPPVEPPIAQGVQQSVNMVKPNEADEGSRSAYTSELEDGEIRRDEKGEGFDLNVNSNEEVDEDGESNPRSPPMAPLPPPAAAHEGGESNPRSPPMAPIPPPAAAHEGGAINPRSPPMAPLPPAAAAHEGGVSNPRSSPRMAQLPPQAAAHEGVATNPRSSPMAPLPPTAAAHVGVATNPSIPLVAPPVAQDLRQSENMVQPNEAGEVEDEDGGSTEDPSSSEETDSEEGYSSSEDDAPNPVTLPMTEPLQSLPHQPSPSLVPWTPSLSLPPPGPPLVPWPPSLQPRTIRAPPQGVWAHNMNMLHPRVRITPNFLSLVSIDLPFFPLYPEGLGIPSMVAKQGRSPHLMAQRLKAMADELGDDAKHYLKLCLLSN